MMCIDSIDLPIAQSLKRILYFQTGIAPENY
jgi:hypothetical protein